jgi:hypothetical protein
MLVKNRFYDLPLLKRYEFIKDILRRFPSSMQRERDGQDLLDSIETVLSGSPLRFILHPSPSAV